MKLASSDKVLEKLGTGNHADSVLLANAGLEFATAEIENVLNTSLAETARLDIFDYFPSKYADPYAFTKLQLLATQGFLDIDADVTVYLSTTGDEITADNYTTYTPLDAKYYAVNYEQGTIALTAAPTQGLGTIAVVYTAGYADEAENVPEWLREAAVAYAVGNIQAHNIGYNKKGLIDKSSVHSRLAYSTLSNKIRSRLGTQPSQTVVL